MCRPLRDLTAALCLGLLLAACGSDDGAAVPSCANPAADCSLANLATAADLFLGAAIAAPKAEPEQVTIGRDFNSVTAENAMKWGSLARTVGHYDFTAADEIVAFARERNARIRGHNLVWRDQQPSDLESQVLAAADPAARMHALLEEHIETVVGRYRGRVESWDVVNEPLARFGTQLDDNLFERTLGDDYIDEAFALARESDPGALLFLNEFFYVHDVDDARVRSFRDLVADLRQRGVPIDGVGIQAHFFGFNRIPGREDLERLLRSFSDLGLLVEITELDISIRSFGTDPDPFERQAEAYADVFAACLAVSGCRGVTTWGMVDSGTWLDRFPPFDASAPHFPLLFDGMLQPKPARAAVREVIQRGRSQ